MMPKTVWNKGSMPLVPARFRGLYTWVLPVTDIGMILFGLSSYAVGSKVVSDFVLPWFSSAWSITTFVGGVMAIVGLVFMKDRLEIVGRLTLGIGLLIYVVSTTSFIFGGSPSSILPLILTIVRVAGTVWRIADLAGEIGRKAARA